MERVGSSIVVRLVIEGYARWELEILPGARPEDWRARFYRIDPAHRGGPIPLSCGGDSIGREYLGSGMLHLNTDDLSDLDEFHGRLEGTAREGEFPNELVFEF